MSIDPSVLQSSIEPATLSYSPTVQISTDRLQALEQIEASIPTLIENAIAEYKKGNLRLLHLKDKSNPKAVNERVKRYAGKHREEINRRRREKRAAEKLAKQASASTVPDTTTPTTTPTTTIIRTTIVSHPKPRVRRAKKASPTNTRANSDSNLIHVVSDVSGANAARDVNAPIPHPGPVCLDSITVRF